MFSLCSSGRGGHQSLVPGFFPEGMLTPDSTGGGGGDTSVLSARKSMAQAVRLLQLRRRTFCLATFINAIAGRRHLGPHHQASLRFITLDLLQGKSVPRGRDLY